MTQDRWTAVDEYISDLCVGPDPALEAALADCTAAGLPAINVTPNQGKLLMLLAQSLGAQRILEIGTLGGYSTIWLARGLSAGGRLMTLEVDPRHAAVARANIARAGLSDVVDLRLGRALETLAELARGKLEPFDLVFIDADKATIPEYFDWSVRHSRPGAAIVVDNVVRKGAVIDADSDDASVQGVRRFFEKLAGDRRVSATGIQTVGSKGYDGFCLALVRPG
jgi:predicted O-methyltransferase YrrM